MNAFAENFFGYGSWRAPFWFVGMEEGGMKSLEEFAKRLAVWDSEGRPELLDLVCFHQRIETGGAWFGENPPLQRTWRLLMRALLVNDPSDATLRAYQSTKLGRADGENALLELLPFPSSSTRGWIYGQLNIARFKDRPSYVTALREDRCALILERVAEHRPRAVVFYGNPSYWRQELHLVPWMKNVYGRQSAGTKLIATTHPTAYGSTNLQWDKIGRLIYG